MFLTCNYFRSFSYGTYAIDYPLQQLQKQASYNSLFRHLLTRIALIVFYLGPQILKMKVILLLLGLVALALGFAPNTKDVRVPSGEGELSLTEQAAGLSADEDLQSSATFKRRYYKPRYVQSPRYPQTYSRGYRYPQYYTNQYNYRPAYRPSYRPAYRPAYQPQYYFGSSGGYSGGDSGYSGSDSGYSGGDLSGGGDGGGYGGDGGGGGFSGGDGGGY